MATLNDLLVTGSARFVNTINGKISQAIKDGNGNTITSYYCTLNTNQTIAGTKTFQANIQVNGLKALTAIDSTSYGLGTAGQVLKSNGTNVYWSDEGIGNIIVPISQGGTEASTAGRARVNLGITTTETAMVYSTDNIVASAERPTTGLVDNLIWLELVN